MIIKGKGFILRPIKVGDARSLLECYKDEDTKKGFMGSIKTLSEAKKFCEKMVKEFRKKKPSTERWIIEVNGKFAGWVQLSHLNEKYLEHRAKIGYCIHPKFRKRGLATEGTKLLVKYAFKKFKLKRIEANCREFNKGSIKTLKKVGFQHEGTLRKNKCKNGKYFNDMVWSIIK